MRTHSKKIRLHWLLASLIIFFSVIGAAGLLLTSIKNKQAETTGSLDTKNCMSIKNPQPRQICQAEQLDQILLSGNITEAFELVKEYYKKDLLFQKQCHSYSHRIGEKGYEFFYQSKKIVLGDSTSDCGFGFYHGFMEALVHKTNDMAQAREFCNDVASQTRQTDIKAEGSCYHGIGHGVVDGSDPRSRGNPYKIVEPGIDLCEKVTTNEAFRYQCAGGIFNSLAIMYTQSQNGLQRDQDDPFKVCYGFKGYILDACLNQMNTYVISLADKDLKKVGEYVYKIPQSLNAENAMDSSTSYLAAFKQDPENYGDIIKTCQGFRNDLVNSCIDGYAAGLIEFGPPAKEYEAPIVFCQNPLLSEKERNSCFKRSLSYMKIIYSSNQFDAICSKIDAKYRVHCTG